MPLANPSGDGAPSSQMQELADALHALRDAWTRAAWTLRDLQTDRPSPQREAALALVREHLRHRYVPVHVQDGRTPPAGPPPSQPFSGR